MNVRDHIYIVIAWSVALALLACSGCALLKTKPADGGGVTVGIEARGVANLGSLEMTLTYDPSVIKAVSVGKGTLAPNASLEYSVDSPGRVWLGMADASGINGSGTLAVIDFDSVGSGDRTSSLNIEKVAAYRSSNLGEILTQPSAGSLRIKGKAVSNPSLAFSP